MVGSVHWPHCRQGWLRSQRSRENMLLTGPQPQPQRALATLFPPKNPALEEGAYWRRQLPALAKKIWWRGLCLREAQSWQGKLSVVLNCQTMLHPNTEVAPVTTFAPQKLCTSLHHSQPLPLHQVFPLRRKHGFVIKALGSGLPPLHAAGKSLLASVSPGSQG